MPAHHPLDRAEADRHDDAMRHMSRITLLAGVILLSSATARADGYFSKGDKKLVFLEEGDRTKTERITMASLIGATVLTGAVGTFYLLDSRSQSDKVSASGSHTLLSWDQALEDTHKDAVRSSTIAKVSIGMSGGLALATIVAYIVTQPDMKPGYQDWQASNIPVVTPIEGGAVMSGGWSF